MRRHVLDLCLLAYPPAVRARDGEHLRQLALDLAVEHGTGREALGLLRGGLAARRRPRTRTAFVASAAVVAVTSAVLVLVAPAAVQRAELDELACAAPDACAGVEAEVEARVGDGWECGVARDARAVVWRCARD